MRSRLRSPLVLLGLAVLLSGCATAAQPGPAGEPDPVGQSAPAAGTGTVAVDSVGVAAFAELARSPGVVVLDVRTADEFAGGHLPGARHMDAGRSDFEQRVGALDRDGVYAVYCRTGARSAQALATMAELGFTATTHLDGGITAWQAAGGEVVVPFPR